MYGLEAIAANNGWAMAVAGALIVMTGLAILSFVISQLPKVAALLEKGFEKRTDKRPPRKTKKPLSAAPQKTDFDLHEAKKQLKPLAAELGETFDLKNLYELANNNDLPHVHLTIKSLREAGVIVPVGDGPFRWQE